MTNTEQRFIQSKNSYIPMNGMIFSSNIRANQSLKMRLKIFDKKNTHIHTYRHRSKHTTKRNDWNDFSMDPF